MLSSLRRRRGPSSLRRRLMPSWLRRRLGVRMRSALAAGIVVAFASVLAGGILLVVARGILLDNVDSAASDRTAEVTAALTPRDAAALQVTLHSSRAGRGLVQVLTAGGTVVDASAAIAELPPMSELRPPAGQHARETTYLPIGEGEPWLIEATGVATADGQHTVLVAESLDVVSDSTAAIVTALLLGLPMLAVVVGVATFHFVGRTLQPVEAMRRQAATITATNLHARLPLPAADDEIAALATTMNTMLDRIEASAAAQRRFVADASHELRSPLTTIRANADLLAADASTAPHVQRIRAESARMSRLVDDLLLLARVDDQRSPRRQDVDLDDLIFAERDRVAVEHPHLRIEGAVSPVRVTGDPDQLTRVVRNLVDNTVRHARERVTISLTATGGQGEIVVGNDGPPIPPADRERIFHRFVRLDDSRSRGGGGSGLGLAIARDIITTHQGTLTVDDLPEGAAMRIRLPTA
ncbi:histidine kinase [Actinoplanes sp. SE50]|uniref:sensor histidine kinase n=1 Tax=unclassified Actinoplanes TaxID=2626549 RepID=UPI00023EC5F7|nr:MULTISPECIES: HAMP domain-containing sensor histidine kinase [unclassified Actinoplanes]AEV84168.1 two-component histidine kinase [Actinoplanes sp. SE50/110]ATO82560.1 histidine kinase [Actinoplanes sp. SE50]SLL99967.1 two-component sensor histidine kinase [Actinoplanes sp. SE50/110]